MKRAYKIVAFCVGCFMAGWTGVSWAAEGGAEIRLVNIDERSNTQGFVREYDGSQIDVVGRQKDAVETDIWLRTGFGNGLLDLGVKDINSSDESAFLDLVLGSYLSLNGNLDILTHRQAVTRNGTIIDGVWEPNGTLTDLVSDQHLLYKRAEGEFRLRLAYPGHPSYRLVSTYWEEHEKGSRPLAYYNRVNHKKYVGVQNLDRFTKDISAGVEADIGKGGVTYDYTARRFDERASTIDENYTGMKSGFENKYLKIVPNQKMNRHRIGFRYRLSSSFFVAAGASSRKRDNELNDFKLRSYSGHLSMAYRPTKNLRITGRFYDRIVQIDERTNFEDYDHEALDFYSLKADIKARYTGVDHAVFTLGYKPEHTYRRHTKDATEHFMNDATYLDGTFVAAETHENKVESKDTKHKFHAGAGIELPMDAELDLNYDLLLANRPAYESSPTNSHDRGIMLTVPCPQGYTLMAGWDNHSSENKEASFTNYKRSLNRFLVGAQWVEKKGRYTAGINYGLEDGKDKIDVYWGDTNTGYGCGGACQLRYEAGTPYEYKNSVLSGNVNANLSKGINVSVNSSYATSKAAMVTTKVDDGTTVNIPKVNPTDIRMFKWGVSVGYEITKDVTARMGYYQDHWMDKYDDRNDGRANVAELALSAKF